MAGHDENKRQVACLPHLYAVGKLRRPFKRSTSKCTIRAIWNDDGDRVVGRQEGRQNKVTEVIMLDVLYTYISSDVDSSDMDAVRYFVSLLTSASQQN